MQRQIESRRESHTSIRDKKEEEKEKRETKYRVVYEQSQTAMRRGGRDTHPARQEHTASLWRVQGTTLMQLLRAAPPRGQWG